MIQAIASPPVANDVGRNNEAARIAWLQGALAKIPAGGRILDAGAGEQPARPFCSHLRYVSQDFIRYDRGACAEQSRGAGERAGLCRGGWETSHTDIISDIAAIPEPDGAFDAVMCSEALHHVPDAVAALRELARLVRPGGYLILTAPFCSTTPASPRRHATGFSRYFFGEHLPQLGFEILDLDENGNFFEHLAQETRQLRSVARRYAGGGLRDDEMAAIDRVLTALRRLSLADRGSAELVHLGCHVLAQKSAGMKEIWNPQL